MKVSTKNPLIEKMVKLLEEQQRRRIPLPDNKEHTVIQLDLGANVTYRPVCCVLTELDLVLFMVLMESCSVPRSWY